MVNQKIRKSMKHRHEHLYIYIYVSLTNKPTNKTSSRQTAFFFTPATRRVFVLKKAEFSRRSAPLPIGSSMKGGITKDLVVLTSKISQIMLSENRGKEVSIIESGGYLVGGWTNPSEKYAREIGSSSPNRGEKKKYLKPPPSYLYTKIYHRKLKGYPLLQCHVLVEIRTY